MKAKHEGMRVGTSSLHQVSQFSRTFETIRCKIFALRSTFCQTPSPRSRYEAAPFLTTGPAAVRYVAMSFAGRAKALI